MNFKKTLLSLSLMTLVTAATFAVPARPGQWKTVKLSNGTEVRATLCGDEHAHFWRTADGLCLREQEDGTYATVTLEQIQLQASQHRARAAKVIKARNQMRRVVIGQKTHYVGQKKGIVILVQFTDTKFKTANNLEKYKKVMNTENYNEGNFRGSVSDFFKAQSNNTFELDFDVVGPYTMTNGYAYYGKDSGGEGNDQHADEMVAKACQKAAEEVNFADYDWDGDGEVDQVYVVYAGKGQADGGNSNTIWPHMYSLDEAGYGAVTLDGVKINTYACGSELDGNGSLEGIGTFCHEFSHCLGFPDFYDTAYQGWFGMSQFDLMDSGSYNGNGFCPPNYTAHEKMMCGWQEPIVLGDEDVKVENLKSMSDYGETYVIYNDAHPDEYFMIENRQKKGWDASYPAKGLMISHVDFNADVWLDNTPNTKITASDKAYYGYRSTNDHQRMTIMHADNNDDSQYYSTWIGGYTQQTLDKDLYPYQSKDSLTPTSKPAPTLYNKNKKGTKTVEWAITGIKQNSDGTMNFFYRAPGSTGTGEGGEGSNTDPEQPKDYLFYESFNKCVGTGANDNLWSGAIASSTFKPDQEGWTAEQNKAYGANQCAKFGTANIVGTVTSPEFEIDGDAVLTFMAAPFGSDSQTLSLDIEGDAVLETTDFLMQTSQWTEFKTMLNGSGNIRIVFSPAKRFFLDEVLVKQTAATGEQQGIGIRTYDTTAKSGIYTLDGRYVGVDRNALPRGLYIINGKKVVR